MICNSILVAALALVSLLARVGAQAPAGQVPYTFYQLQLQDQFVKNQQNIRGKPYESYFKKDLYVYPEMIEPGRTSIDCPTQALKPDLSDINKLLIPANQTLDIENGWCAYDDGSGYVASRTHFPGSTGAMASWWLWWHSAETARYTLWHPWAHVSVSSSYAAKFSDPTLNNTQKLFGSVHKVSEIIGDAPEDIEIHWFPASHFGIDEAKFAEVGGVATGCGELYSGGVKIGDMVHLFFQKADASGIELRSRYFLGNKFSVNVPLLGDLDIDLLANTFGIKKLTIGRHLASNQFHHDQQEFTHLASFLPQIYKDFGNNST
ncbi:hypothetical protein IE53DRAFT_362177 [Violaceomyces palustris]|uniref:Uncharacterized protein n=1 Tax=Violaceomyces palustris TaxID=1673888 RepID=A0ACD0NXV6_9BASI|nr:hypothetical protein IE53DRAFT_362177 [Violaceomyces palustris]